MYLEHWERYHAPTVEHDVHPDEPKLFCINKFKAFLKKIFGRNRK